MSDNTLVIPNVGIQATEAPGIANEVVDITKQSRTQVASKRAPKKPNIIVVSVDNSTLYFFMMHHQKHKEQHN